MVNILCLSRFGYIWIQTCFLFALSFLSSLLKKFTLKFYSIKFDLPIVWASGFSSFTTHFWVLAQKLLFPWNLSWLFYTELPVPAFIIIFLYGQYISVLPAYHILQSLVDNMTFSFNWTHASSNLDVYLPGRE